jgi:hypothetical protein
MPNKEPTPHVIHPTAIYSLEEAQALFRLRPSTVRREVREGRLRIARRAGRYFLLGEWLLAWLKAGEILRRPHRDRAGTGNGVGEH